MANIARNRIREAMEFRSSPPPPRDDLPATVAWLRDRELIKDIYARYAYAVDSVDESLLRSVFHRDCVVVGTMEQGSIDDYITGLIESLPAYESTMHFKGNQYLELSGDEAFVETWVVAYHMEAAQSPIDSLVLGLRYQDDLVRTGDDWKIIRRIASKQWHTGPLPRPFIGEPPYPRKPHESPSRQNDA